MMTNVQDQSCCKVRSRHQAEATPWGCLVWTGPSLITREFPQGPNISIHSEQPDWNGLCSYCQVSTNSTGLTLVGHWSWAKPALFTVASVSRRWFRTPLLVSCQGKQRRRKGYGDWWKDPGRGAWSVPIWHLCNGRHLSATKPNTGRLRRTGWTQSSRQNRHRVLLWFVFVRWYEDKLEGSDQAFLRVRSSQTPAYYSKWHCIRVKRKKAQTRYITSGNVCSPSPGCFRKG